MNIVMLTNTYLPHVGGVAKSVASFTEAYRRAGHHVLVIAPTFEGEPRHEWGVIRIPAIQKFNGSDFSVRLPVPGLVTNVLDRFRPDVVHSHHPFLLGDTALRIATWRALPLVFTHHTMYERYTHYVPGDSPAMRRFAIRLATGYANLCDHVIAPSESIAAILRERGVQTPISAIPTGIEPDRFAQGDGAMARRRQDIPADAPLVGHVGRLAHEKNLHFLAESVTRFLHRRTDAHALIVGDGAARHEVRRAFERAGVADRLRMPGKLTGRPLADAYHAMDCFAFASHTETQGMVLAEAMTAGVPVVAVDAPGVREVVADRVNGRLLGEDDAEALAAALAEVAGASAEDRAAMQRAARETAERFSIDRCAAEVLRIYERLGRTGAQTRQIEVSPWADALRWLETEWNLWSTRAEAAFESIQSESPERPEM